MPSEVLKGYTVTCEYEFGSVRCAEKRWEVRQISTKRDAFKFAWEAAFAKGHAEVFHNTTEVEWYFDKQEDGRIEVTEM